MKLSIDKKEKETSSKMTLLETGLTEKQKKRQFLQNQLDSVETEEEKLRNIKEWKRNEFLEIDDKKKAVDKENLVHEN